MSDERKRKKKKKSTNSKSSGRAAPATEPVKKFPVASLRILDKGQPVAIMSLWGKVTEWGSVILSGSESMDDDICYQVFLDNGYAAKAAYAKAKEAEESDGADEEDLDDDEEEED
jgi:hypothetical protein